MADLDVTELLLIAKGTRSYEDLARDMGYALSAKRLQQIGAAGPASIKAFPEADTIAPMAQALNVSVRGLLMAYAKSLNLPVTQDTRLQTLMPAGTEVLTDRSVRLIRELVQRLVEADRLTASSAGD